MGRLHIFPNHFYNLLTSFINFIGNKLYICHKAFVFCQDLIELNLLNLLLHKLYPIT